MNKDLNNLNQIIPEEQNKPEIESGTASERFVSLDIKEAIEKGTTGDFYYFTEAGDGKYQMHAKLPEYGCAGPGEPIFKILPRYSRLILKLDGLKSNTKLRLRR